MDGSTRRGFVVRSGATLGAFGALGLHLEPAAAAAPTTLTPAHQATYGALVATLAATNDLPADVATVREATDRFSGWHASLSSDQQVHVATVLDAVEKAAGGFSAATPPDRLYALRAWRHAPVDDHGVAVTEQAARRRAFAEHAVMFASPPYAPEGDLKPIPLPV